MAAISPNKEDLSVDTVHTPFGRTKHRQCRLHDVNRGPNPRTLPKDFKVMLRPVPLPMKRCRPTTTYRTNQERTAWPQLTASGGPISHEPEPASPQPNRRPAAPGTPRGQCQRDLTTKNVHTLKQKPPLTRGYAVPEVGLERDSRPWAHWEVAETCGIRANPAAKRGRPGRNVRTLSTLLFATLHHARGHIWARKSLESRILPAGNVASTTVIRFTSFHILHGMSVPEVNHSDQLT